MRGLRPSISSVWIIVLMFLGAESPAKTTPPPDLQVYANFFGTWTGTDNHQQNGVWKEEQLELTISPSKSGMRFDYDYGVKGAGKHERYTRLVTFFPKESVVTLQWKDYIKEIYKATGLAEFAQNGFGSFYFAASGVDAGVPVINKCTFTLDKNSLSYSWDEGRKGTPFALKSVWNLTRVAASGNNQVP